MLLQETSLINNISTLISIVIVVLLLAVPLVKLYRERQFGLKIDEKIQNAESKVQDEPLKAKPAWDLARTTLEAYFNRNLNQISWIFWLSVLVMLVGFIVMISGVYSLTQNPRSLDASIVATGAGVITEFIGASFLFIYKSTMAQAAEYSKTLERINSVGMAMQILDTMPDETKSDDLKSQTKSRLVELLVHQSYTGSG